MRRTRINKINAARRSRRFKKHYWSEGYVIAIKTMPCTVCRARPSHAHHVKTKAAGGDYTHLVPLCPTHHHELHNSGVSTFSDKYRADLTSQAKEVYDKLKPLRE